MSRTPAPPGARLVFIDETWASTNMTPRYGRCERGKRLIAHTPFGVRDDPVERLRSRGDFVAPKPWQNAPEIIERAPHAIASKAAANGKQVRCPSMHFVEFDYFGIFGGERVAHFLYSRRRRAAEKAWMHAWVI